MNAPLVSVVTPFHNTAAFLDECISSVLAQTCRDFEYVLLDNCSDDGSTEIALRHAAADSRIRYLRNATLLPQVPNYNHAMAQASPGARFVKVVQADDALFPRCLEEMVALAEAHPSVAVVSSYRLRGRTVEGAGLARERQVLSGRDACRLHLVEDVYLFGSPTTVMFRADVVRSRTPFWAEGRLHEDTEAVYEILADRAFGFVHQVLSFSRLDAGSITGRVSDFGPDLLDKLILFELHGRRLLSPDEFELHAGGHRARYLRFLAEAWLRRRDADFWSYHRQGLRSIGEDLAPLRIARQVAPALAAAQLPPALLGLVRRLRRSGR
jgi:glycosyltransferase involved in cell wall biosynthesis